MLKADEETDEERKRDRERQKDREGEKRKSRAISFNSSSYLLR